MFRCMCGGQRQPLELLLSFMLRKSPAHLCHGATSSFPESLPSPPSTHHREPAFQKPTTVSGFLQLLMWTPGIELRLLGVHDKCLYLLSHLTALPFSHSSSVEIILFHTLHTDDGSPSPNSSQVLSTSPSIQIHTLSSFCSLAEKQTGTYK